MNASQYMERWADVPGFGDVLEASDLGRIRTKDRYVVKAYRRGTRVHHYKSRLLSQWPANAPKSNYLYVMVSWHGKRSMIQVGRLVLLAFAGQPPEGQECCHNDGDATNNRPANLRWDSHANNNRDKVMHGTDPSGERHHAARLTENVVRQLRSGCVSIESVMRDTGMKYHGVWKALTGRTWRHVR